MALRTVHGLVAVLLTVAMLAAFTPAAWAGPPTEQLRVQMDRVIKVLEDPELKRDGRQTERRAAVRRVVNEIFDFNETSRRSLGPHWNTRTPAEREQFVQLYADLLERSYIGKIEPYSGERIQFIADSIEGDQATVRTRLATKAGTEIPVDYRMHRVAGDRWLTYDVVIEGVSMIANYRAQFNKIIQASGYPSLVSKLTEKREQGLETDREPTISKASQPK
jgi:phospholipid transport system substrate-binding protein